MSLVQLVVGNQMIKEKLLLLNRDSFTAKNYIVVNATLEVRTKCLGNAEEERLIQFSELQEVLILRGYS